MPRYKAAIFDLADKIQHLLRPADGKRGDNDVAAAVERALDAGGKPGNIIGALVGVVAVAVGGFDYEVIGFVDMLRVAEYRLIEVAYIAGENYLFLAAALLEPDLDSCRAEQMPDVGEAYRDRFVHLDLAAVFAGAQQLHKPCNIVKIVKRLDGGFTAAHRLARFPFGVGHLYVRAVAQHYVQQRACSARGVHGAAEAVFIKQRQKPRVVDVRVGDQHKIKNARRDRQLLIFKKVLALLHTAVDNTFFVADFEKSAAACDLMGSA